MIVVAASYAACFSLRICLINNFPPYSGTGRVPYALWREFKEMDGIEADLICTHVMKEEEFGWEVNRDVRFLHKFAYKDHENLSRFLIYFVDPFRIPRGYDIYHVTNHMLARYANFRRPCVVTLHDVLQFKYQERQFGRGPFSWLYNRLMLKSVAMVKKADAVICVSEWSKEEAIKLLSLDPKRTFAIHNGLDHEIFKPYDKRQVRKELKLPEDAKIILHVGAETPRKNVLGLMQASARVKNQLPNAFLVRLGEKTKEVADKIKEFGLEGSINYLQEIKDEEVAKLYSSADVLVLPSFEEGFGLPIIEAMACGTPVVTSNCGAMKEIADDAAILADSKDIDSIAKAIKFVLTLPASEYEKLVNKGIERAKEFSWQKCAKSTLDVYEKVLTI